MAGRGAKRLRIGLAAIAVGMVVTACAGRTPTNTADKNPGPGSTSGINPPFPVSAAGAGWTLGPVKAGYFQVAGWDGQHELWVRWQDQDSAHLLVFDPQSGKATREYDITALGSQVYGLDLLGGGLGIVYSTLPGSDQSTPAGIWYEPPGKPATEIASGAFYYVLSDDRKSILLQYQDNRLAYVDFTAGGQPKPVPDLPAYEFPYMVPGMAWSGHYVAGEQWNPLPSEVVVVDLSTQKRVAVLRVPNRHVFQPSWSPDGQTLAVWSLPADKTYPPAEDESSPVMADYVYFFSVTGSLISGVPVPGNGGTGNLAFSPAGDGVAFLTLRTDQNQQAVTDVLFYSPDGQLRTLASSLPGMPNDLTWAPDGSSLLVTVQGSGSGGGNLSLWLVDPAGVRPPYEITATSQVSNPAVYLPSGAVLVEQDTASGVEIVKLDGQGHRLASCYSGPAPVDNLIVSPDGHYAAGLAGHSEDQVAVVFAVP